MNTNKKIEKSEKSEKSEKRCKPFVKWAGGKKQLVKYIEKYYPFDTKHTKYIEPFVGGGAVLFDVLNKYQLETAVIGDSNSELINAYLTVRDNIDPLVTLLREYEKEFIKKDTTERKRYYADNRQRFNLLKDEDTNEDTKIERTALLIFLNKTCFNGLYRENRNGQFNVPMGTYESPTICDETNLRTVSEKLRNVTIYCGNYTESEKYIDEKTFVYLDPPYRPISNTSSFRSYTQNPFSDKDQIELAIFFDNMTKRGAKILMSNSDPHNIDKTDNYFDDLYHNYHISRIKANRAINCKGTARDAVSELLISNYTSCSI